MCHYITAIIPNSSSVEELNQIAKIFNLAFTKINNKFVQSQLNSNYQYLSKLSNHCDCGTVIGSCGNLQNGVSVKEKEIKKLQRKGWGKAKIQRWLDEKEKYKKKQEREELSYNEQWRPQTQEWYDFIQLTIINGNIKRIGLLLHWYESGPTTEKITIRKQINIHISQIEPDYLTKIQEDNLYLFEK